MKKLVAVLLAVVMIFAVTAVAAADEYPSPSSDSYYKISTDVEGGGSVNASTNKIQKNTDGTVTLIASDDGGYFNRWIIKGTYDIIDGSLTSPTITIRPTSDINAIANFSKEKDFLNITTEAIAPTDGTASVDKPRIPKDAGEIVTLTATETNGTFIEWELQCEYNIVEGNLKSKVLKIEPLTDIHAIAYFKGASKPGEKDEDKTSPKTGDPLYAVIPFMMLALAAAFIASKKLRTEK
jgi:hypothetical protein